LQSNTTLWQGDCLELMKDIPDGSIDLTVTSPPYDNLRSYNGNISQWSFAKFQGIAKELYRVTKQGGVVVWVVGDATINGSETGTSFRQALFFMECGFNLHDTMIWKKQTFTDTGSLKVRYAGVFEYMFVFVKGKLKTFNPIKDRENKSVGKKKHGVIRQVDGATKPQSSLGKKCGKLGQRFNVWEINTCVSNSERTGHPAQYPEQLASDHIISWSNEGDVVFDPFMGSGTTGKMALLNSRNFIGIELDETYFDIAQKRIAEAQIERRENP
jgi:DNA modification methylase